MGRHEARTEQIPVTGRHAHPLPPEPEKPAPTRPRIRDGKYANALVVLNAILGTFSVGFIALIGLLIFMAFAAGIERVPSILLLAFIIWCFRRHP